MLRGVQLGRWRAQYSITSADMRSPATRRIDLGAAGDVFLEDVVLDEDLDRVRILPLLLGERHVQRKPQVPDGICGGANLPDALERDAFEQHLHVRQGVDRDSDAANLPERVRVV